MSCCRGQTCLVLLRHLALPVARLARSPVMENVNLARWSAEFEDLMGRIGPRFARPEPRERGRDYIAGLVSGLQRKNSWWIAEHAGERLQVSVRLVGIRQFRPSAVEERTDVHNKVGRCHSNEVQVRAQHRRVVVRHLQAGGEHDDARAFRRVQLTHVGLTTFASCSNGQMSRYDFIACHGSGSRVPGMTVWLQRERRWRMIRIPWIRPYRLIAS
jgi:hypothetical protein